MREGPRRANRCLVSFGRRGRKEKGSQEKGLAAYKGDGLDADGKDVTSEIARVGEGVFFPELGKSRVHTGKQVPVKEIIACVILATARLGV